jgi:hypothetical protein
VGVLALGRLQTKPQDADEDEETKYFHPGGPEIPTVWVWDGENARGSIMAAEAFATNEAVVE